ncbi:MAG: hypothetical protein HY815_23570 [Candidatus Riflebacteria bacterium]|nr:hypothetical protein [Candidatus Riflebacteria bacterium]
MEARSLNGTISLAAGMDLVAELKDGTIGEMMRFLHVSSQPRERVNLNRLGAHGDRLFIGTDYYLYCEKNVDGVYSESETYKVGRAHKLWEIKLADGVQVAEVESALDGFTGEGGKKALRVDVGRADKKASDVERTGMKFWLDEIVYQYDSPGRRRGQMDNYQMIMAALIAALPSRSDDPQDLFNNFKVLTTFVKEAKDGDLVPFRDLLAKKIQAVQHERESAGDASGSYEETLKAYESLRAAVVKRTEGF